LNNNQYNDIIDRYKEIRDLMKYYKNEAIEKIEELDKVMKEYSVDNWNNLLKNSIKRCG